MKKIFLISFLFICPLIKSQERLLFSANSQYMANSEYSFSVCVGEPIIGNLSSTNITVNQGFLPLNINNPTTNIPKTDNTITVYPNPFAYSLNIKGLDLSVDNTISFISTDGHVIHKEKIQNKTINTSILPSGCYIVMITGRKEVFKDIFIKN